VHACCQLQGRQRSPSSASCMLVNLLECVPRWEIPWLIGRGLLSTRTFVTASTLVVQLLSTLKATTPVQARPPLCPVQGPAPPAVLLEYAAVPLYALHHNAYLSSYAREPCSCKPCCRCRVRVHLKQVQSSSLPNFGVLCPQHSRRPWQCRVMP
jgi:hypothetical protein